MNSFCQNSLFVYNIFKNIEWLTIAVFSSPGYKCWAALALNVSALYLQFKIVSYMLGYVSCICLIKDVSHFTYSVKVGFKLLKYQGLLDSFLGNFDRSRLPLNMSKYSFIITLWLQNEGISLPI